MLKKLTSLQTPELLHALASTGHGDEIVIVDANFPAVSMAQRLMRLDGSPAALKSVLQLIPLDTFVDTCVRSPRRDGGVRPAMRGKQSAPESAQSELLIKQPSKNINKISQPD
jgi:L-fucose mutarotase/ribose pyranase (RbsD/FucU family)